MQRRPWMRALHAALSGLLAGLLAVGPVAAAQAPLRLVPQTLPAAAAGSPRVLVVAVPLDPAARAHAPHLAAVGSRAVAESGRFEAVDLTQALDAEGMKARAAKAEEAAAAFAEGKRAYDDELDTQKALVQFEKAVRAYEGSDLLVHFPALSRARVMKVASQVANGETKAAELEVERLLGMDPKAQFSPQYFPPEFITFVEKTRAAVLAEADSTLEVKTGTVPAQVYVDGQFRGVSPAKVTGLTRAEHYVTVLAPGYAVADDRARDGEVSLDLVPTKAAPRLQAAMERISRDADGPGRDAAALELGTLAGTQQVLLLLARGGSLKAPVELTALRLDGTDGHSLGYATGRAPVGDGLEGAAKALLAGVVGADAPRVGGKPVTHFDTGPSPGRRTAGYVLMATGVALVAGGVFFGLEASSRADRFNDLAQTDPRADNIRSEGKTFALLADVGMIAGLASAGAGTWLAFFGGKGSGGGSTKSAVAVEPEPKPEPRPAEKPVRPALPMPPPPGPTQKPAQTQKPAAQEPLPMPPPPKTREPAPPAANPREERKAREEAARREREAEEQRKREEAERLEREAREKREREEAEKREREAEEKRKREEAEKRKREEEKKKKRPTDDEDDLRNY